MGQRRKFPDEPTLQAYLQGRLDDVRRRQIEIAAARDPELSAWIKACAAQYRGMHILYDNVLNEPIPDNILRIIDQK